MEQFNFLIDPDTKAKLTDLANSSERTAAAYLRWLIKREWSNVRSQANEGNAGENGKEEAAE